MFLQKFFRLLWKNPKNCSTTFGYFLDTAEEKQNKLKKKESFHVFLSRYENAIEKRLSLPPYLPLPRWIPSSWLVSADYGNWTRRLFSGVWRICSRTWTPSSELVSCWRRSEERNIIQNNNVTLQSARRTFCHETACEVWEIPIVTDTYNLPRRSLTWLFKSEICTYRIIHINIIYIAVWHSDIIYSCAHLFYIQSLERGKQNVHCAIDNLLKMQ